MRATGNAAEAVGPATALVVAEAAGTAERLLEAARALGLVAVVANDPAQAARAVDSFAPDLVVAGTEADVRNLLTDLSEDCSVMLVGQARDFGKLLASDETTDRSERALPAGARRAVVEIGPLKIDSETYVVEVEGRTVFLAPIEFAILQQLAEASGAPLSAEELARRVWPKGAHATVANVHRMVYRLRVLLVDHERTPPLIISRRGFGYALNAGAARD